MLGRYASWFTLGFAVAVILSCHRGTQGPSAVGATGGEAPAVAQEPEGLQLRLFEASESATRGPSVKVVDGAPLTDAQTRTLLARLPDLVSAPEDRTSVALRPGSTPPPRSGLTVLGALAPQPLGSAPEAEVTGPLEVVRFAPEGELPLAAQVSVTFSHPMVPVSQTEAVAADAVPVKLEPTPPAGKWRWIGTKTLLFEPEGHMPMATTYRVTVPQGTHSALGTQTARPVTWQFSTPAPTIQEFLPQGGPTGLQPVIFIGFDQRVDPAQVVPRVILKSNTGKALGPVRLATQAEIDKEGGRVTSRVAQGQAGRWVALVPASPLPVDTGIDVTIDRGLPSLEGPRTTQTPQGYYFHTFGALSVVEQRCGWEERCPPGTGFEILMSNPIDVDKFDADALIRVEPELPQLQVEVYDQRIYVRGNGRSGTTYRVTLSAELTDTFGQTLARAETLRFKVTDPEPMLTAQGEGLVVLDPAGKRSWSVISAGLRELSVRAWAVQPSDWARYHAAVEHMHRDPKHVSMPGRKVIDRKVRPSSAGAQVEETAIDLAEGLPGGRGHLVVVVEAADKLDPDRFGRPRVVAWVQATSIGLQAHSDGQQLIAWTTDLANGSALPDTTVELLGGGPSVRSDKNGIARVQLGPRGSDVLVARSRDDVALLPRNGGWSEEGDRWQRTPGQAQVLWYVFDDRHLYRPGETVKLKGWLRVLGSGPKGDLETLPPSWSAVRYRLMDSQGNELAKGRLKLNAFGAFDASLQLPSTMNLGGASVMFATQAKGGIGAQEYGHWFEVQEFRRPEYEVSASLSAGPHLVGQQAVATVQAAYYAGGGLAHAEVRWSVRSSPGSYQPPGHDGWVFGIDPPWWMFWRHRNGGEHEHGSTWNELSGRTDGAGKHYLGLDFISVTPARPTVVHAEATVTDVNRQAWTASTNTVVHAGQLYVGLKQERPFVAAGESFAVDALVADIDGKMAADVPVQLQAVRVEWKQVKGEMVEREVDPQVCDQTSEAEPVRCTFVTQQGGTYRISAVVKDGLGRANRTETTLWVTGGDLPPPRQIERENLLLIPDAKDYQGGQVAKVAVAAPWPGAHGLVTLRRQGLVEVRPVVFTGTSSVVEVAIDETMVPGIVVQVDAVGAAPRRDDSGQIDPHLPPRPAYASGTVTLSVPPRQRVLALEVVPQDRTLEPGGATVIDVTVKDARGAAVPDAEVALVAVDEAVLALSGYVLPDPLGRFYGDRDGDEDSWVRDDYLREYIALAQVLAPEPNEQGLPKMRGAPAKSMSSSGGVAAMRMVASPPAELEMDYRAEENDARPQQPLAPIALRSDFSALALFAPSVRTDAAGHAKVPLQLPDNLTRYRVMAIAVAGARQFGAGESTVTARLPLMVRPSPPRFLNFGDEVELPVVVQNQTDKPMTVELAMGTANLPLSRGGGRRVQVPAGDRVEVRFAAKAGEAGTARAQVVAVAGRFSDAASFSLPVWTPGTSEAFATYGVIDEGAIRQPVVAPKNAFAAFGGLEITTSSTALQELSDAVLYLVRYPFECSEQISSRVLAIAALRDVLDAFSATGLPSSADITAAVQRDLEHLSQMQADDGGFGFWGRTSRPWPYVTIHVTHALERAKLKGFAVPESMLSRARAYVQDMESHLDQDLPEDVRRVLRAYALYVRRLAGASTGLQARALIAEAPLEKWPLEALGWLLPTLAADPASHTMAEEIQRHLGNRVSETAADAHFVTDYSDGAYLLLDSDRRADGVLLEALIEVDPKNDLIPKLVRGLLDHRRAGAWASTQENAFVLLALDRYFRTFEAATPNFVARAWLGTGYGGQHRFAGRTTERHQVDVPMAWLLEQGGSADLVLQKQGPGRMYYRVGMRYAPKDLVVKPYDAGFTVRRIYEAVDDPGDVVHSRDGSWTIEAGARVRVRIKMVAPARRYHVALVDPLPAGLEALNPVLATTGTLPSDPAEHGQPSRRGYWSWMGPWYEHQNLRDERAEAFAAMVWDGVYEFDYIARATTPGRFVVPPPKAEEMYHPETFGRGGSDVVVVQ